VLNLKDNRQAASDKPIRQGFPESTRVEKSLDNFIE